MITHKLFNNPHMYTRSIDFDFDSGRAQTIWLEHFDI
jgi:hypothetical protein